MVHSVADVSLHEMPRLMGPLLCLQEPVSGPYPKPDEFSPHPQTLSFNIHFNSTRFGHLLKNSYIVTIIMKLKMVA
jgi:hypothetical protein